MILFALRRFLGFAATLLLAAVVIFYLLDLLPGDPARFTLGITATPEAVANLRTQMGLDAPAHERLLSWIGGMLRGDFGMSYTQRAPVAALLWERLAVTLPLTVMAMVVSVVMGLPLGILSARARGKAPDTAIMVLAQLGVAVPQFLVWHDADAGVRRGLALAAAGRVYALERGPMAGAAGADLAQPGAGAAAGPRSWRG
jgi:peptide/nickel transport system permease protein